MNKKKTAITIFFSILLIIIVSCSDINPFFAGGVVPGGNWIYFAEGSNIKKMRLDGSEVETIFTLEFSDVDEIQLDPFRQKIYVLNVTGNIYKYDLDGQNKIEITGGSFPVIYNMVIDHVNGYLYIITSDAFIGRYSLNTMQFEAVYNGTALGIGSSLAPDYKGNIYLIDSNSDPNNLYKITGLSSRFNMELLFGIENGLSYNKISNNFYFYDGIVIRNNAGFTKDTGLDSLAGSMVISALEDKIFFRTTSGTTNKIYSMNLDGTDIKELYSNNIGFGGFDILSK